MARCALLIWMLLLGCASAWAGSFSVLPTRLNFSGERGVHSVMLTNTSATTVTLESQVVVWADNAPGLQASDVLVSPAVVTLPPGQRVRVRVGLMRAGDGSSERAYRLYFTELPAPAPLQGAGIGVRLRVGIPLFVAPQQPREAALQWAGAQDEQGWHLLVRNPGNVHARAMQPVLVLEQGPVALNLPGPYVLAGAAQRVPLPPELAAAPLAPWAQDRVVRWTDGHDSREARVAATRP